MIISAGMVVPSCTGSRARISKAGDTRLKLAKRARDGWSVLAVTTLRRKSMGHMLPGVLRHALVAPRLFDNLFGWGLTGFGLSRITALSAQQSTVGLHSGEYVASTTSW